MSTALTSSNVSEWARQIATVIDAAMRANAADDREELAFELVFTDPRGVELYRSDFESPQALTDPEGLAQKVASYVHSSADSPVKANAYRKHLKPGLERVIASDSLRLRSSSLGTWGALGLGMLLLAATAIPLGVGAAAGGWVWGKVTGKKK